MAMRLARAASRRARPRLACRVFATQAYPVPSMGDSISEGTLLEWMKKPGDAVAMEEVLASVETDKVTVEVRAEAAGVVTKLFAAAGDNILVGDNFIEIDVGAEGGAVSAAAPAPAAADAAPAAAPAAPAAAAARRAAAGRRARRRPHPPGWRALAHQLPAERAGGGGERAGRRPGAAAPRRRPPPPPRCRRRRPTPSTRSSCPRATAASR